jgi:hypothetical protein
MPFSERNSLEHVKAQENTSHYSQVKLRVSCERSHQAAESERIASSRFDVPAARHLSVSDPVNWVHGKAFS